MTEKQLISKLKGLKQVKPSQDWAVLLKKEILGEPEKNWIETMEAFPKWVFSYNKLAFSSLVFVGFIAGAFAFSQNALPGDPLFALKSVTEKTQAIFVSEGNLPNVQLGFVNKRLEELTKIAQTNQTGKLAPAIQEFQANVMKAAEDIMAAQNLNIETIVSETRKLEENREKIESLGIDLGETKEFNDAMGQLVEREIKDLENRMLTDEQEEILENVEIDFENGNYSKALEGIVLLSSCPLK